ncbi:MULTISPECIES: hypothetical protein [Vibrio]|uniref:hypothetical protein n=1 Tax=Vibrio TaxID=662 RepID=UPI0010819E5D|nr:MULTISPECIES: hypothetical protein [Vibrio]MCF7505792.1 hypothetical protein [Vibrio sp. L3-7]TVU69872.1 hypothetical protein FQP87_20050 [Vibrio tasmaniensis]
MKTIKLILSGVTLMFLSACGGGGGGSSASSPSSVVPPSNTPAAGNTAVTSASMPIQQSLKSVELSIPEGFDFSTEREVSVKVDVASSQSTRGFMTIYTEFNGDVVDYTSQVLRSPINEDIEYSTTLLIPNHVQKVWVEIWYPSAIGSEVKRSVDIVNNNVEVLL